MTQTTTPTSKHIERDVVGYAPTFPDIPIYIHRDESSARSAYRGEVKKYRIKVIIEELD